MNEILFSTANDYARIPEQLRHPSMKRWVVFKVGRSPGGQLTKFPVSYTGRAASSADPQTWGTFGDCVDAINFCIGTHLGFALTGARVCVCDLDNAITDGKLSKTAERWLEIFSPFHPYVERSVSGKGVHIITWYTGKPLHCSPEPGVEFYSEKQFILITGRALYG